MRPVPAFARKLTLSPDNVTAADANANFTAGWDDRALYDVATVCGLFSLINRLVCGLGIEAPEADTKSDAQRLAQGGYAQLIQLLSP